MIFLRGLPSSAASLNVFYWEYTEGLTHHLELYSPRDEIVSIEVEPERHVLLPNVTLRIDGISIDLVSRHYKAIHVAIHDGRDRCLLTITDLEAEVHRLHWRMTVGDVVPSMDQPDRIVLSFDLTVRVSPHYSGPWDLDVVVFLEGGAMRTHTVEGFLVVETELDVTGELGLKDSKGVLRSTGEWASPGVDLELRGLHLRFRGTDVPPAPSNVSVSVESNETGTVVLSPTPSGEVVAVLSIPLDDVREVTILVRITTDFSTQVIERNISLRFDGAPPHIIDVYPDGATWFSEQRVLVACLASDDNGSGIREIAVQFGRATKDPGEFTVTETMGGKDGHIEGHMELLLEDGCWNIRWRVFDMVGNGPVFSEFIVINVDSTDVRFDDFSPSSWVNTTRVGVGVTVSDFNGSGVDLSTISVAHSQDGLFTFSPWTNLGLSGEAPEVPVGLLIGLREGTRNYVRFRASDLVGNNRTSNPYRVRVDTTPPEFSFPVPVPSEMLDNIRLMSFQITINDRLSGVDPETVRLWVRCSAQPDGRCYHPSSTGDGSGTYVAEVELASTTGVYIQWIAEDIARSGHASSGELETLINQPPTVDSLSPRPDSTITTRGETDFELSFSDPEGDDVSVRWTIDGGLVANGTGFSARLETGTHEVLVTLDDSHGNTVEMRYHVKVEDPPDYSTEPTGSVLKLSILLVVFGLIALIAVLKRRGDKS